MVIPLAAFIGWGLEKRNFLRGVTIFIIFILIAFSLFKIKQFRNGVIHWDSMNKTTYWMMFFKLKPTQEYYDALTKPNYVLARQGIYEIVKPDTLVRDLNCIETNEKYIRNSNEYMK